MPNDKVDADMSINFCSCYEATVNMILSEMIQLFQLRCFDFGIVVRHGAWHWCFSGIFVARHWLWHCAASRAESLLPTWPWQQLDCLGDGSGYCLAKNVAIET